MIPRARLWYVYDIFPVRSIYTQKAVLNVKGYSLVCLLHVCKLMLSFLGISIKAKVIYGVR